MSVHTDKQLCTGCGTCVNTCPGDLLLLGKDGKAILRERRDCWDCMVCVKACPSGALDVRLPYQVARKGATIQPEVGVDYIRWILQDRAGGREEFLIPTT